MAGMLATYQSSPAFFAGPGPADTDPGWTASCYPQAEYTINMGYDPERAAKGRLTVKVRCTVKSLVKPEDIAQQLVHLISGTFYTNQPDASLGAMWQRTETLAAETTANAGVDTGQAVCGMQLSFDLLEFPVQLTTDPDPIRSLNQWTKGNFPELTVIGYDNLPSVWQPNDTNPAIYWRLDGAYTNERENRAVDWHAFPQTLTTSFKLPQQSYAANWYSGQFAAHLVAGSVTERNDRLKALAELIQLEGEIPLTDGSPMFIQQLALHPSANPLRAGQLLLTGQYGVLTKQRKPEPTELLNHVTMTNLALEISKQD